MTVRTLVPTILYIRQSVKPSQRGVLTNTTQVWGVAHDADTGLIYASDMNSGLWILRRTG